MYLPTDIVYLPLSEAVRKCLPTDIVLKYLPLAEAVGSTYLPSDIVRKYLPTDIVWKYLPLAEAVGITHPQILCGSTYIYYSLRLWEVPTHQ